MSVYHNLREIGASVETADAIASEVKDWPKNRQDALVLWAGGYTQREAAESCGVTVITFKREISKLKMILFFGKTGIIYSREDE